MAPFAFTYGPRLIAGPGRSAELGGLLPPGRCLFVTDSIVRQLGLADWAILDATLTLSMPRGVPTATGIDAMVHAIEAYTSARLKNPMSDLLAREALRLLTDNFLLACDRPEDPEARGAMLLGAHLAGVAFANAPVAG